MAVMIDWLTVLIPYEGADVCGGRQITIDEDGEAKFEKLLFKQIEGGSFSAKTVIKTVPFYGRRLPLVGLNIVPQNGKKEIDDSIEETGGLALYVSGNPSKYLQGHNVFGVFSHDLIKSWLFDVFKNAGISDLQIFSRINNLDFEFSRIDLTDSFQLNSKKDVINWLKHASFYLSGKFQSCATTKGFTSYIGKNSRRKTWKFYSKGEEVVKPGRLLIDGEDRCFIQNFAQPLLRSELVLRRMQLKDMNLLKARSWSAEICEEVYMSELLKMKLPGEIELDDVELECLPKKYRSAYALWKSGKNVSELYSRTTYWRYKKFFYDTYQINLDIPRNPERGVVVPLIQVLKADRVSIPQWAYDRGLIYCANF